MKGCAVMADCYYHGYSGGPGACSICQKEDKSNIKRGSSEEKHDQSVTMHDWQNGRSPRQGNG